jgi:hypothetical protein
MILKARINASIIQLNELIKLSGLDATFLTNTGLCSDTSEIIGAPGAIMSFIGFLATFEKFYALERVEKV